MKAEPSEESIQACTPRLQSLVDICRPKLIICVGKLSETHLRPDDKGRKYKHQISFGRDIPMISIVHPAAILRANIAQKGLMVQRAASIVLEAVEDIRGK